MKGCDRPLGVVLAGMEVRCGGGWFGLSGVAFCNLCVVRERDQPVQGTARVMDCRPEEIQAVLAKEEAAKAGAKVQQSVPAARRASASAELATLRDRRRVYIEYARHRIDDQDWYGDAANDLRELDVEIRMLEAAK